MQNADLAPSARDPMSVALGCALACLCRHANAAAAGHLVRGLQLGAGSLGLLASGYVLAFAAMQLVTWRRGR